MSLYLFCSYCKFPLKNQSYFKFYCACERSVFPRVYLYSNLRMKFSRLVFWVFTSFNFNQARVFFWVREESWSLSQKYLMSANYFIFTHRLNNITGVEIIQTLKCGMGSFASPPLFRRYGIFGLPLAPEGTSSTSKNLEIRRLFHHLKS